MPWSSWHSGLSDGNLSAWLQRVTFICSFSPRIHHYDFSSQQLPLLTRISLGSVTVKTEAFLGRAVASFPSRHHRGDGRCQHLLAAARRPCGCHCCHPSHKQKLVPPLLPKTLNNCKRNWHPKAYKTILWEIIGSRNTLGLHNVHQQSWPEKPGSQLFPSTSSSYPTAVLNISGVISSIQKFHQSAFSRLLKLGQFTLLCLHQILHTKENLEKDVALRIEANGFCTGIQATNR